MCCILESLSNENPRDKLLSGLLSVLDMFLSITF